MKEGLAALVVTALALLPMTACSSGSPSSSKSPSDPGSGSISASNSPTTSTSRDAANDSAQDTSHAELADSAVVFAAASLSEVFPQIVAGSSYSFDGSSGLVDQLSGGAPADVFVSADKTNMDKAVEAGVIEGDPILFATNFLTLVVPAGNPAGVTGFDSSLDSAKLVTCATEVPCGAATQRLAVASGTTLAPVSEESSVTDVLGKVISGEADAGIVYVTDATRAGDSVEKIDIAGAQDDPNTYWIAQVRDAPHPEAGAAFIAEITGTGASVLQEFGFGAAR